MVTTRLFFIYILIGLCSCSENSIPQALSHEENPQNTQNCNLLHAFIKNRDYQRAIKIIKDDDLDINCIGPFGEIPITSINYTTKGSKDLFQTIVNHPKFDGRAKNSRGENGLFNSRLTLKQTKILAEKGADINAVDIFGETPLNSLDEFPDELLDKVQFFMEHKSYKKNQKSLNKMLHFIGDPGVLIYLLAKGAQISFDQDNRSPLHHLIGAPSLLAKAKFIMKQAQKKGFDLRAFINHKTKITSGLNPIYDGDTALHEAVRNYSHRDTRELIEHLLAWGADPDLKNNAGESARDIGARTGYVIPAIAYRGFPKGHKKPKPGVKIPSAPLPISW